MRRIASLLAVCAGVAGFAGTALAAGVDELPPDIQSTLYNKDQIDPQQPIGPSAYRDWKPKKGPPWTIGYASSYAGNTWRAAALEHLENDLIPKWKKLGLVKDVIVTQSNLEGFRADPTDAPTRRSRRRRADHLLLEPDRPQRDRQIRL